jgi:hypothetical protein
MSRKTQNSQAGEAKKTEIRYMVGSPKQYRADAKTGSFNINGRTHVGNELSIQPIAYRFFNDNLFNRGEIEWAEVFFVDESNCISSLMFNGVSLQNLKQFTSELFYEDAELTDIKMDISWSKQKNEKVNATYHVASFEVAEIIPESEKKAQLDLVSKVQIYRSETLTPNAFISEQKNFFIPNNMKPTEIVESEQEALKA